MNSCFDDDHGRSDIDLTYGRDALSSKLRKLSDKLYNLLTWDRGNELPDHKRFTMTTDLMFTSVTHKARGSASLMKIPTDYSGNTSQKAQTYSSKAKRS